MSIDISGLDAIQLEALIMRAAQKRAQLLPMVSTDCPRFSAGIRDPQWFVMTRDERLCLLLRDPGLGWMTFVLPPVEASNMGRVLIESVEKVTPAT